MSFDYDKQIARAANLAAYSARLAHLWFAHLATNVLCATLLALNGHTAATVLFGIGATSNAIAIILSIRAHADWLNQEIWWYEQRATYYETRRQANLVRR